MYMKFRSMCRCGQVICERQSSTAGRFSGRSIMTSSLGCNEASLRLSRPSFGPISRIRVPRRDAGLSNVFSSSKRCTRYISGSGGGRGATQHVTKTPSPRLHAHRANPESRPDVHAVVICKPTNAPSFGAELESYITRALITPPHGAGGDRPSPAPRLRSTDTVVVVIPGTAEAAGQHAEVLATN